MVLWHWVQQHRVLSVLVLTAVMAACAGGTAWALVFRTVSSPVTLREALRIYRREQTAKMVSSLRNRLIPPGVYSYRTSGGEGLDLMGVQRGFPTNTPMIATDGGRCATVTWTPIVEHTEATVLCRSASGTLWIPRLVTNESIAGTDTTSVVNCPRAAYLLPTDPSVGTHWRARCSLAGPVETVEFTGRVFGQSTTPVGSQRVSVEHVRTTLVYRGSQSGANPIDLWIEPTTGLIVREQETSSIEQGGVHYSEHMEADLTDLTPSR